MRDLRDLTSKQHQQNQESDMTVTYYLREIENLKVKDLKNI